MLQKGKPDVRRDKSIQQQLLEADLRQVGQVILTNPQRAIPPARNEITVTRKGACDETRNG